MTESLTSLDQLKGVGPKRRDALAAVGIRTVTDLLAFTPRQHRTLPKAKPILDSFDGDFVTLKGTVCRLSRRGSRRRKGGHLTVVLDVENHELRVDFFNQGFLGEKMMRGQTIAVTGTLTASGSEFAMTPIYHEIGADAGSVARVQPIYPTIPDLKQGHLVRLIESALGSGNCRLDDPIPGDHLERRALLSLQDAITTLHQPKSLADVEAAVRRMTYDAYLAFALRVSASKKDRQDLFAPTIPREHKREVRATSVLGFTLTKDQSAVIEDIRADLSGERPMLRLLQGDVGCGKTAVAGVAALDVAMANRQVAILAPTEVLARQLHQQLSVWARPLGLTTQLLVGGMAAGEKRQARLELADGTTSIAVGTHAIIQDSVHFNCLGLVVVDEQHRFGVMQRLRLVRKGMAPHVLAMTATPIPRTLAMTTMSDLDLSTIRRRPKGRGTVTTHLHVRETMGPFAWQELADRVRAGERTFVVFPAIESEEGKVPDLLGLGEKIRGRFFGDIPSRLLHGRMSDEEKVENLEAFRNGDVHLLFATTVIEVGVDVPDATRIVIVGADRFGLAQLHQLRGRVGRGGLDGRCDLLARSKKALESTRLALLASEADGFVIAEHDLEVRGPGDIMGVKQHGFSFGVTPGEDEALLFDAFEDAARLISQGHDPLLMSRRLMTFARARRTRSREFIEAG